jgi:hypothetical protein
MRTTLAFLAAVFAGAFTASAQTIICAPDAPPCLKLATKEVRRYVYLRTGKLLPIANAGQGLALKIDPALTPQEFRIAADGIAGGSEVGVLYGAYRFAELLGVRFYLHGDVVPEERLQELPAVNDAGKPLFALRGVNPWGSHPFGFDAWSTDDYKAIFTQLAKLRMNFLGIHCYPEGHPYAEPTVWHGLTGDFDAEGRVSRSYLSRYYSTAFKPAWGSYWPKNTSDYSLGGAILFEDDVWAPDVLRGHCPEPKSPDDCNEVFNRMAVQFRDAFTFARQLGVKTCLGTESPLTVPKLVRDRLQAQGKNPADPAAIREVYEGTFRRIMASQPLDYYWLWTPEGWTWANNSPVQYANTVADIKLAVEAWRNVNAPFQLATCGWVLGPVHDRAAFDNELPKNIPMSAISRHTGATEVEPAFGRIAGREKWAIPWLESDNRQGLAGMQLEAGRMRRDAADAREHGCTGLMGLHWRTEILSPNVSALAQAAWDQRWFRPTAGWTVPGQVANYPNATIAGTSDAPLYRSCRYDLGAIRLKAPAGKYKVTLKFCEPHFNSAGQRICDVQVQGQTVLTNLDIFAKVGQFAALDYTFDDVAVTNGVLTVELVARKSLPCISAIAVESPAFTSKINCGGPAYKDWQVDVGKSRGLPCGDFYADWARANFGYAEAGQVFAAVDGHVPASAQDGCPTGGLTPVTSPWSSVASQFAFVDEFEQLRPRIRGAGNLDRFDYWLNTFKYCRALARTRCAMGAKQPEEVLKAWTEAYTCLLATVNTPGALAMVVNMENHPGWGAAVAKHAAQPWPKEYQGPPRLIVPTVRSVADKGESLTLRIIALDRQPVGSVSVKHRPLGSGQWQTFPATHLARAVWQARLPAATEDFEYYLEAQTADAKPLHWPATAPQLNQTVVIRE